MNKRTALWFGLTAALGLTLATPALADGPKKETKKEMKKETRVQKDRDGDVAVSTTRTTSFTPDGRDVAENRASERRDVEDKHWTLAPLLGWATSGYGFGIGGRIGYTFSTPIYVGGNFMFHGGEGTHSQLFYPSAEVGYDIGVSSVLLRPYGGVGILDRNGDATGLVYPGFTAHWLIPRSPMFVGGDARILIPFDGDMAALSLMATTGLNF